MTHQSPPIIQPVLAYNESSLPAASFTERLQLVQKEGLALEVANQGNFEIVEYQEIGVAIAAVQAYAMHEFHPLHCDRDRRIAAVHHVYETLELAAKLNVPRIVTVCGFGHDLADHPFERCLDFFSSFVVRAKELGVRIMIEPLSPKRAGALTAPQEIACLVDSLNQPEVFSIMLDTGHLADSGVELNEFFCQWNRPIEELQLKGLLSTPPSPAMPLKTWLQSMPQIPAVVCVEHRQAISMADFTALVRVLREALGNLPHPLPNFQSSPPGNLVKYSSMMAGKSLVE